MDRERIQPDEFRPVAGFELALSCFGNDPMLPAGNICGPGIRNYYLLQYCLAGRGVFYLDDRPYPVEAGQFIVIFPGQVLLECADATAPWGLTWLGLNGSSAGAFFAALGITPEAPVFPCTDAGRVRELIEAVVKASDIPDFRRDFSQGALLFALFDECARQYAERAPEAAPVKAQADYAAAAVRYLENHYADHGLTIGELARHVGLNRSYLYSVFKARTGVSPQNYLARYRIAKACEFLRLPRATVSSVAFSVGYDPLILSKAFKRHMGITPSEYRRRVFPSDTGNAPEAR